MPCAISSKRCLVRVPSPRNGRGARARTREPAARVHRCDQLRSARRWLPPSRKEAIPVLIPKVVTVTKLIVTAHIKQRDLVVASILAVPDKDAKLPRR